MSDQTPPVLDFLREQFARVNGKLDRLSDDMREVKQRVGYLEEQYGSISRRTDSLDTRLERIERRLDLTKA